MTKKLGDVYTVDSRGLILASTYEQFTKNSWNAINMLQDLDATEKIDEFVRILAMIQPISNSDIDQARDTIKVRSNELIEAQKDLAILDTF